MFFVQFTHVRLAQRDGDTVDASFDTGTQVICLKSVLGSKLASSFSDCMVISDYKLRAMSQYHPLSSCRLSINACFWPCVKRIFLAGGPLGVASGALINSGDFRFKVAMVKIEGQLVVTGKTGGMEEWRSREVQKCGGPQQTRWSRRRAAAECELPSSSSTPRNRPPASSASNISHFPSLDTRHHVARSYYDHVCQFFHPKLVSLLTLARSVDNSESSRNGDYT